MPSEIWGRSDLGVGVGEGGSLGLGAEVGEDSLYPTIVGNQPIGMEWILIEDQPRQVGQFREFSGNDGQLVVVEIQFHQVLELGKLRWDCSQILPAQGKRCFTCPERFSNLFL
jgi:hypothetical protein